MEEREVELGLQGRPPCPTNQHACVLIMGFQGQESPAKPSEQCVHVWESQFIRMTALLAWVFFLRALGSASPLQFPKCLPGGWLICFPSTAGPGSAVPATSP